jgi:hypothetical protein
MDTLETYRQIIETVLTEYAKISYAYGDMQTETIFDRKNDHYLLIIMGWNKDHRIHGCLVHIDMLNDKVWIQGDGTEEGIAVELEQTGIPKKHIVLGFRPPEIRKYSDYAVA